MRKRHPGIVLLLLLTVIGCGAPPRPPAPSGPSEPEDRIPLFTDTRLNGAWRVSITDPSNNPLLEFLDGSCLNIFALAALSLEAGCEEETLWGSFPATAPSANTAELELFVLIDGVRREVVMRLQIQDGTLVIGTVQVSIPASGLTVSASITLQLA